MQRCYLFLDPFPSDAYFAICPAGCRCSSRGVSGTPVPLARLYQLALTHSLPPACRCGILSSAVCSHLFVSGLFQYRAPVDCCVEWEIWTQILIMVHLGLSNTHPVPCDEGQCAASQTFQMPFLLIQRYL